MSEVTLYALDTALPNNETQKFSKLLKLKIEKNPQS